MVQKHITLLSKLRADTRTDFAAAGIHTLQQIVAMQPDELRKFRRIKTSAVAVHAHARAWVEERPIWYGVLHPACHLNAMYFDIETRQNEDNETEVWSIGWGGAETGLQSVVVASVSTPIHLTLPDNQPVILVSDAQSVWRTFAQAVSGSDCPIFHWTAFDAGVMRKSAPQEVTEQLAPRLHDLCKIFDDAVKLPVKGVSLKTVARHFGFHWHGYEDWFAAFSDYLDWQRTGSVKALASACAYQRDDVEAMIVVQRWLAANAPDSTHKA